MIIPADLLNVLNSRIWSEDELLQAFVTHLDSGGAYFSLTLSFVRTRLSIAHVRPPNITLVVFERDIRPYSTRALRLSF